MMMVPIGGISKKTSSSRHGSLNPFHSNIDTPVNANNGDKKGFLNNNDNDDNDDDDDFIIFLLLLLLVLLLLFFNRNILL